MLLQNVEKKIATKLLQNMKKKSSNNVAARYEKKILATMLLAIYPLSK